MDDFPSRAGMGEIPQAARSTAPVSPATGAPDLERDEQTLLAGAIQRLRETTGCELVAAWARRADGAAYVAAATFEEAAPPAPDAEAFAAAAALTRPCDLSDEGAPPRLVKLFAPWRSAAVVPVPARGGAVRAVLVLASRAPAAIRPRLLAVLDAVAHRLAGPLAAARAAARLAALDDEVQRLDRLAALGTLAAEIAHEIRNPLVSVKTFLQLLPERGGDPDFVTGFLEVATQELLRVERLLDLLIEYPRERQAEARASLAEALAATAGLLHHSCAAQGVRLQTRAEPDLPEVGVEADALRQLLLNLALNAVSATPPGGRVRLEAWEERGGVELRVVDEGPGVPDPERDRIFEPFHSTGPGQHGGLGLAITRRIVDEAGGRISLRDAAGGGAEFRVWLPRA